MKELNTLEKQAATIVDKLHEEFGVCGHCGKRECAGRKDHSILKGNVPIEKVLEIINGTLEGG